MRTRIAIIFTCCLIMLAACLVLSPPPARAQLEFLPYVDAGGAELQLRDVQMLSPQLGYGYLPAGDGYFQLYRTQNGLDGGSLVWEPVGSVVDTGLHQGGMTVELSVYGDRIWYVTSGGEAGTMGYSTDGGQTWTHGVQHDDAWPYRNLVKALNRWWVAAKSGYTTLLESPGDSGQTWTPYEYTSIQDMHTVGTQDYFALRAYTEDAQPVVSARVLDSTGNVQQISVSSRFPAEFNPTSWHGSRSSNAVTFLDLEDETSGKRWALVSVDMAQNYSAYAYFESDNPFRLEEAFAPNSTHLYLAGYDQATGQRQVRTTHEVVMHREGSDVGRMAMQGDQEGNAYALRLVEPGSQASKALARLTGGYNVSRWGVYNSLSCNNGQGVTLTVNMDGVTRSSTRTGTTDNDKPTWEGQADTTISQVTRAAYTFSGCGLNHTGEVDFDPAQGAGRCNIFAATYSNNQPGVRVVYGTTCGNPNDTE